jgi:cellulose biosynthesis protein BcsQ
MKERTPQLDHLSWMYADLGLRILAADLDPQANLTAAFLEEERLEKFWPDGEHSKTVYGSIEPLLRGVGDIIERLMPRRLTREFICFSEDLP